MGKPTLDTWESEQRLDLGRAAVVVSRYRYKVSYPEYIGVRSERGELKHLSTRRKGYQPILR